MANFWNLINKVIEDADVLLLLLDSRMVEKTINSEVIDKAIKAKKPLIYVFTKCDLVDKNVIEKYKKKYKPSSFVSAKEHLGTTLLRTKILIQAKKAKIPYKLIRVGVLGYPNVGKSSLINSITGKGSASTSILSGHTKGVQKVRADNRIMFLDTPGVIPYKEKDSVKHSFIGTVDFTKSRDPDIVVMKLMDEFPGKIEKYYSLYSNGDKEKILEEFALKMKFLKRGNEPDIERVARFILKDWQKGKIV